MRARIDMVFSGGSTSTLNVVGLSLKAYDKLVVGILNTPGLASASASSCDRLCGSEDGRGDCKHCKRGR